MVDVMNCKEHAELERSNPIAGLSASGAPCSNPFAGLFGLLEKLQFNYDCLLAVFLLI